MSTGPSGYQTPRTNWASADVVQATDLNRIEGNISAIETGSRTIDQSQAPSGLSGSLRQFLDWFANRIKAITGAANWHDAPATTLSAAKSHIDAAAPHSGHETPSGAQAKVDAHAALTTAHGSTSAATANTIMQRDSAGRAKVAAPSAADDIAIKATVDNHASATSGVHGVGASTVESAAGAQAKVDAHNASPTAHGLDRIIADIARNFYDDYLRTLELYYTGHFSGPDIAGLQGMTFDGFVDTNRVNTGATTAIVDTTNKAVVCPASAGSELMPTGVYSYNVFSNPANAIDNNLGTSASFHSDVLKIGYVAVDLGSMKQLYGAKAYAYKSGSAEAKFSGVDISADGSNWVSASIEDAILTTSGAWYTIRFGKLYSARYVRFNFRVAGGSDTYVYACELRAIEGNQASGVLQSTTKSLVASAASARLHISVKEPTGCSVTPVLSADGGSHFESLSLASSRTDPLDSNYTEKTYSVTFAYPGSGLILKATLTPNTTDKTTPEIKRYGLYWL